MRELGVTVSYKNVDHFYPLQYKKLGNKAETSGAIESCESPHIGERPSCSRPVNLQGAQARAQCQAAALLPWDEHWVEPWEGSDPNASVDDVRGNVLLQTGRGRPSYRARPSWSFGQLIHPNLNALTTGHRVQRKRIRVNKIHDN
jgi:hypothetical protein